MTVYTAGTVLVNALMSNDLLSKTMYIRLYSVPYKLGGMMLLGWESNTSIWPKSAKPERGNVTLGVGNPRAPHPLYETLHAMYILDTYITSIIEGFHTCKNKGGGDLQIFVG